MPPDTEQANVVPPFADDQLAVVEELLTTTRSIRKRLDLSRPVDVATIQECIDLAVHAPSSEDRQNWRWLVVTDAELRAEIAKRYHHAWLVRTGGGGRVRRGRRAGRDRQNIDSVTWLARNIQDVPAMVIPCVLGRPPTAGAFGDLAMASLDHLADLMYYGSVLPAVWSFQLALRSRGLGSVITCMHLPFEDEVASLLGIPKAVTQICLLPVGHIRGDAIGVAERSPAQVALNGWSDAF